MVLENNFCKNGCSDGFYLSTNNCLPCHTDCQTCNGGNNTNCILCKPELYKSGNLCIAACGA